MWETWIQSLGWEDPLEKEKATHSSILDVATREESGVHSFPSRRGLTSRVSLECNPEIPVAPGEKNSVLDTNLDELYFALQ